MRCFYPRRILSGLDPDKYPQGISVPCGQCMSCRILRREEWVLRLQHEMLQWQSSMFVTLTYDEGHLPDNSTLVRSDLTRFFKRLRRRLPADRPIKYFAAGEYGSQSGRPHYHCIIFGLDYLSLVDRAIVADSWQLCDWQALGRRPYGDVNAQSMRYVVSYLEDKTYGTDAQYAEYTESHRIPPYHVVSHGLGAVYARSHADEMARDGCCTVHGYARPIPRYYRKITELSPDVAVEHGLDCERDMVEQITGLRYTLDDQYMRASKDEIVKTEDAIARSNRQHDLNLRAEARMKEKKI